MIVDLLKSYSEKKVHVTSFSAGSFTFDCHMEESHESRLVVSENPIESGALISDHSYLEPRRYSVRGILTSYTPFNFVADTFGDTSLYNLSKNLPFPLGVSGLISQAEAFVNRYASTVKKLSSKTMGNGYPTESLFGTLLYGDGSETVNRIEYAFDDLMAIQDSKEVLDVKTTIGEIKKMVLQDVVGVRGADDQMEVSLSFKEINIVSTEIKKGLVVNVPQAQQKKPTSTPSKPNAPKTGRSADQSATAKSKGKTSPTQQTEAKKKSVLKGWFE